MFCFVVLCHVPSLSIRGVARDNCGNGIQDLISASFSFTRITMLLHACSTIRTLILI